MESRILLVDDCDLIRRAVLDYLRQELPEAEYNEAADGETALAVARETLPNVVVMDIGLPGMSGLEATRQIKSDLPCAKVVIFTLFDDPDHRRQAEAAGADEYVLKDHGQEDLARAVRRCLALDGCARRLPCLV